MCRPAASPDVASQDYQGITPLTISCHIEVTSFPAFFVDLARAPARIFRLYGLCLIGELWRL